MRWRLFADSSDEMVDVRLFATNVNGGEERTNEQDVDDVGNLVQRTLLGGYNRGSATDAAGGCTDGAWMSGRGLKREREGLGLRQQ